MTLSAYLPIALAFILAVGFAVVSLTLSRLLAPKRPTPEKLAPYECGIVPLQEPAQRFPVKFYLVAMLFVIFDVEIVFLFAWAVRWESFGWAGIAMMGIFVLLVVETLFYVWKRGALDWNVAHRARYRRIVAPGEDTAAATQEEAA
jgi:NADH-quinone oxidoreductase subunit A